MFSRFTSMLHHAVEALVPNEPLKKAFVAYWKDITCYFTETKVYQVSVDQTIIPQALESMLNILVCEEQTDGPQGMSGPCFEYLLRSDIVETLYTLARTDCPPGMKQCVLQFFTKLLSRIKQPLLPYVNVHTPMQRLVRLCGETKAAPTEAEEVQFLCTLCAKVKTEPYLVSFFLQPNVKPTLTTEATGKLEEAGDGFGQETSSFLLIESLLKLMSSADARVAVKACEGVLLCCTLTDPVCVHAIIHNTQLCDVLTKQLCALYDKLPNVMDPAHLESVDVHWGLDVTSDVDDCQNFNGKRKFVSFLSWFDYCDQLSHVSHPDIAAALSAAIHDKLLTLRLEPRILQISEAGSITATAVLTRCLALVSSPSLLQAFAKFIVGEEESQTPANETQATEAHLEGCESGTQHTDGHPPGCESGTQHSDVKPAGCERRTQCKLKRRLIERCDSLSDEVFLSSLKLFDVLLTKPTREVIQNLILRDLLPRSYCDSTKRGEHSMCDTGDVPFTDTLDVCDNACVTRDVQTSGATRQAHLEDPQNSEGDFTTNSRCDGGDNGVGVCERSSVVTATLGGGDAGCITMVNGDSAELYCDDTDKGRTTEEPTDGSTVTPAQSYDDGDYYDVHEIVANFLGMLSNEAKSSYQSADTGYDTYLRDAHRQVTGMACQCAPFDWPPHPVSEGDTDTFVEGPFLKMLLDKLSRMLQQSYEVNLSLTSVVSRLALLPHPNIHEYLLNPLLSLRDNCRTLPVVLRKVASDIEHHMTSTPNFQVRLMMARKNLMGISTNIRRRGVNQPNGWLPSLFKKYDPKLDDEHLISATIVLEEFCKELAAVVFVKYHEATAHM